MKSVSQLHPTTQADTTGAPSSNELEKIQSILFGGYAQDFSGQLQALEEKLDEQRQQHAKHLEDLEAKLQALSEEKLATQQMAALVSELGDRLASGK